MKTTRLACLALALSLGSISNSAGAAGICERHMIAAAKSYDVPLGVLYAVGMTETGRKGSLQPYALNIEGKAVFTNSAGEGVAQFQKARRRGKKLIDLGCMQINHHYHGDKFASALEMFDPEKNVKYAAEFLRVLKKQEGNWTMAVARYHAGPNNHPAQKRYVCMVIRNLVASGFGGWTPQSRKLCRK